MADILVVQSKVKAAAKKAKMRFAGEAVTALSNKVEGIIKEAATRAKANRRQTIKASDI